MLTACSVSTSKTHTGLWVLWLLMLHAAAAVATQPLDQLQQQDARDSSLAVTLQHQQHARALLIDTKLYCNVTSECKPCLAKHLDSEACQPTAYTEHLTCSTKKSHQHETTLTIHRRLSPRTTLLHVSRSCRAPAETATASRASDSSSSNDDSSNDSSSDSSIGSGGSIGNGSASEVPLSEQVMRQGGSDEEDSHVSNAALSGDAKAAHLFPLSAVGGLNLLYFELAMLIMLSGALPVVYVRKQRYVRL